MAQVSKLSPLTTYNFRVRDYNSAGASEYSKPIAVTTPPAPLPTPTLECRLLKETGEIATEWRGRGVDSYELQLSCDGDQPQHVVCDGRPFLLTPDFARVWSGVELAITINVAAVAPGSVLHCRVRGRGTKDTVSPFSATQTIMIPRPPKPAEPAPKETVATVQAAPATAGVSRTAMFAAVFCAFMAFSVVLVLLN